MKLSIIEQFNIVCEVGEGDIICPQCGNEIHQYYQYGVAVTHIERGECPICDCEDGCGTYKWCEQCRNEFCDGWQEEVNQRAYGAWVDREIKIGKEMALA